MKAVKTSTIKNPLTVIAIFASMAEVSGTAILPFLEPQNQQVYMWFLILFPIILIFLFFITLNWNHKVLYAPSDFKNEDNFVKTFESHQASMAEIIINKKESLEDHYADIAPKSSSKRKKSKQELTRASSQSSDLSQYDEVMKEYDSEELESLSQTIQEEPMMELLVLNKLENEYNATVRRDIIINNVFFDGIIELQGIEDKGVIIKKIKSNTPLDVKWFENLASKLGLLYLSPTPLSNNFSIILAIIVDKDSEEIEHTIQSILGEKLPIEIRIYYYRHLRNDLIHLRAQIH